MSLQLRSATRAAGAMLVALTERETAPPPGQQLGLQHFQLPPASLVSRVLPVTAADVPAKRAMKLLCLVFDYNEWRLLGCLRALVYITLLVLWISGKSVYSSLDENKERSCWLVSRLLLSSR